MDEPGFLDRRPLPALVHPSSGPLLPHVSVLDEALSPAGVLLWEILRDATLWGTAEPDRREGLFADEARTFSGIVPELEEELSALAVLVRDPDPGAGPVIAHLCSRIAAWAEGQGLGGTALAFAQGAALADAADARLAYDVGRLSRVRAEYVRAEAWYQRALVLAARGGDKEAQARSLGGLAVLHARRGRFSQAIQVMRKAEHLARRHSLLEVQATACHGLATMNFEIGSVKAGLRYAREAMRIFGADHDQFVMVIHDVAIALMDQCGAFTVARDILGALIPHFHRSRDRMVALANLARAAGALGEVHLYQAIWTEVWGAVGDSADVGNTDALIALGRGAASLSNWESARQAAMRGHTLAQARREGKAILLAESLLESVVSQRSTDDCVSVDSPPDLVVSVFVSSALEGLRRRVPTGDPPVNRLISLLASPSDARKAFELGRSLRKAAEYDRAEAWFKAGLDMARASGDPVAEAMCLGGLGNTYSQRGDLDLALRAHQQHLAFARREGLREMEACALLDVCAVSFLMDDGVTGLTCAREAVETLGPDHPALPRLAHDLAVYLMECGGDYEHGLSMLQALQNTDFATVEHVLFGASLARAAAGAGYAQLYEETWRAVWAEVQELHETDCPAGPLIQLARAALIRGDHELAGRAGTRALHAAVARGEVQMRDRAENLLTEIRQAMKSRLRSPVLLSPSHDVLLVKTVVRAFRGALRNGMIRRARITPRGKL